MSDTRCGAFDVVVICSAVVGKARHSMPPAAPAVPDRKVRAGSGGGMGVLSRGRTAWRLRERIAWQMLEQEITGDVGEIDLPRSFQPFIVEDFSCRANSRGVR